MTDLYMNNGDYNLYKVTLTLGKNEKKTVLDISQIYIDITLYESVHSPFMSGAVTLTDNLNILDYTTLGHGETINIEYSTAGATNKISFEGVVYSVSEPTRNTEHSMNYTLKFASHMFMVAKRFKNWSAYKDQPLSDTVKQVFDRTYEKVDTEQKKELVVSETNNPRYILCTGHDTIEVFQMCSKYALSKDEKSGYVFYEDSKQFNFVPLEELYSKDPVMEYSIATAGAYTNSDGTTNQDAVKSAHEEAFNRYQDIEFERSKDYLTSVTDGSLGTIYHFVSLRDRVDSMIDSNNGKYEENLISENPYLSNFVTIDKEGKVLVIPQITMFGDEEAVVRNETVLRRANNVAVNIATFGNSELRVGNMVKANIPRWATDMGTEDAVDRYSGKYMVSEIKHILTRNAYNTRLKLIRDGISGVPMDVEDVSKEYSQNPNQTLLENGMIENIENESGVTATLSDSTGKSYTITVDGSMNGLRGEGVFYIKKDDNVIFSCSYLSGSRSGIRGTGTTGSIWNGTFSVSYYRKRTETGYVSNGVGFSCNVDPLSPSTSQVKRTSIRIHPDGGATGTAGCIGLVGDTATLRKAGNLLQEIIKLQKSIPMEVNITNNPNNLTVSADGN